MGRRVRLGRLQRHFDAEHISPTTCPHKLPVSRSVVGGRLVEEDDPCPCGRPASVLQLIIHDYGTPWVEGDLKGLLHNDFAVLILDGAGGIEAGP